MSEPKRQLAAIMFTDIVGYTKLMGEDEDATLEIIQAIHRDQKACIEKYHGHFMKEMGDGVLSYFDTPDQATLCAINIQRMVKKYKGVSIRIGLHQAEIIFKNKDIFGDGVNIASRIESLCDPGGIYLSSQIKNSLVDNTEFDLKLMGFAKLKNVKDQVEIFAIQTDGIPEPSVKRFGELAHPRRKISVASVIVTLIILIVASLVTIDYFDNKAKAVEAIAELDEIEEIISTSWRDFSDVYYRAKNLEKFIPNNDRLIQIINRSSVRVNVTSDPSKSVVYYKLYSQPDSEWIFLGETPLDSVRVPIGVLRWKFEKPGFETVYAANLSFVLGDKGNMIMSEMNKGQNIHRKLDTIESIPEGMVRVMGTLKPYGFIEDFFIDKYEVTNKQYKVFVDKGGYEDLTYWENLVADLEGIEIEKALDQFLDQTNLPGPATWANQNYPINEDNYPVTGLSWYEADAYAKFVGKELPTKDHWGLARGEGSNFVSPVLGGNAIFQPFSNFQTKGPEPVGNQQGITSFGAYDMPGNVREWCWNKSYKGKWIRGGSWIDNPYMFSHPSQADPFDRTEVNGFRCVSYIDKNSVPKEAFDQYEAIVFSEKNPVPEPISDEQFENYKIYYQYDSLPLNAEIISKIETRGKWIKEEVEINAAYDNERFAIYLFLPNNAAPPYQTVIYGPGSGAVWQKSSENIENYFEFPVFLEFILRSGRAVVFPVLKGTFERREDRLSLIHGGPNTHEFTSFITKVIKDYRRTIDYLETREVFDITKLAFYGQSWGPWLGCYLSAVEPRIRTNIFASGGFKTMGRPESNVAYFMARIKIPTLMINGRFDSLFPVDSDVRNMFNLIGSENESKKLALFDSDHVVPREDLARETLFWINEHFGQPLHVGERVGM